MRIKETQREIARVCTVMTEREFDIHAEAFEEAASMPPAAFEAEATDRAEMQAEIDSEEELEEETAEERMGVVRESDEQLEEEVEEELRDL